MSRARTGPSQATRVPLIPLGELRRCAVRALLAAGTGRRNAGAVADALAGAEAAGIPSHGIGRLPDYVAQVVSGKVDGRAVPRITRTATNVVRADAGSGFAFPAIRQGLDTALGLVRGHGVAALAVAHSHHFGVAGQHVEAIAAAGILGIALGNSPAAIAPWGGRRPLFGTNALAFGFPRGQGSPLVVDLSLSVAARGRLVMAARDGETIPEGWALDRAGMATSDPREALQGSLLPIGGHKGALLAMVVEILAGALTGSRFGYQASSFYSSEGAPPDVGQLFLLLDPLAFGGDHYLPRLEALLAQMVAEPGVRLPGERRRIEREEAARCGVEVPGELWRRVQRLARRPDPE